MSAKPPDEKARRRLIVCKGKHRLTEERQGTAGRHREKQQQFDGLQCYHAKHKQFDAGNREQRGKKRGEILIERQHEKKIVVRCLDDEKKDADTTDRTREAIIETMTMTHYPCRGLHGT